MLSHSYSSDLIYTKKHLNENSFKLFKPLISKSQKLCKRHLSRALDPVMSGLQQSPELEDWLLVWVWVAMIPMLMTAAVMVLSWQWHLFMMASVHFWLTVSTRAQRTHLNQTKLYLLLWVNSLAESVGSQLFLVPSDYWSVQTSDIISRLTSLLISVAIIASLLYLFGFPFKLGAVVTLMTQLCRVLSTTCSQNTTTSSLRSLATLLFGLIGTIVALSRESVISPLATSGDMRLVAWRRRRSSNTSLSVPRRTSLPTLGSGNRSLSYHGNHVSPHSASLHVICCSSLFLTAYQ